MIGAGRIVLILTLIFIMVGCSSDSDDRREQLLVELQEWIMENKIAPEEYVVGLFQEHDVVCLGEWHRIQHDIDLVRNLIPNLHKAGITVLVTEFADMKDQPLIDLLLSSDHWNSDLALKIQFSHNVQWAAQGYIDIYHAAWEFNRSLDKDAEPFRILGGNCSPDWSLARNHDDMAQDSIRRKIWGGCGEREWAGVILEQVRQGRKVLSHSGLHHAFSEYLQPIVDNDGKFIRVEENRMGRYLYEHLGKKVVTVGLHSPWYPREGYGADPVRPADGIIDDVMSRLGDGAKPVGINLKKSPFGKIAPVNTIYLAGHANFRMSDFCDGWIYQRPFSEYEITPYIDSFVNSTNIHIAREMAPNPWYRDATVEKFVLYGRKFFMSQQKMMNDL